MKELKLRLRELREETKKSQEEMAKVIGCSQQTYSCYELHTTEIPLKKLIFLAEFYHTSTDYCLESPISESFTLITENDRQAIVYTIFILRALTFYGKYAILYIGVRIAIR